MKNRRGHERDPESDIWMNYPVIHKTICASGQRERTLVIIGTQQQVELLEKIAESLQRGTFIQDIRRLIPSDRPGGYGHGGKL